MSNISRNLLRALRAGSSDISQATAVCAQRFQIRSLSVIAKQADYSTAHPPTIGCPFHQKVSTPGKCPLGHGSAPLSPNFSQTVEPVDDSSSSQTGSEASLANAKPYESMPTPKALPVVGTMFDLIRAGGAEFVHKYCDNRHTELGSIFREKLGTVEAVFISDPKLIQKIYKFEGKFPEHMVPEPWIIYNKKKGIQRGLFFMNGEEWRARRRTLNQVFLMPSIISEYTGVFNQVISDMLTSWKSQLKTVPEGNTLSENGPATPSHRITDLEKQLYNWSIESLGTMIFGRRLGCVQPMSSLPDGAEMSDLSLSSASALSSSQSKSSPHSSSSSVSTSSFGATPESESSPQLPDIHKFVHCVQQIFVQSASMQLVPPKIASTLKLKMWRRFEAAADGALDLALQYVHENAERIRNGASGPGQGIISHLLEDGEIELEEASRIIVDLFIAAADTTSHATQWALYLLSRNKRVQEKMYQEIQNVTQGEEVEEHHLEKLSYVKGVIKEALRLYPIAPFLTRYLPHDMNLNGYLVPKGQLVVMSIYTTGRSDQHFDAPVDFMPERWIRNPETGRHQVTDSYAALPFGLGARSCIGRRVAEVQMQFFLSRMVQQFRLLPTSDSEVDIKLRMITTPEKAIDLIIEPRQ